MLLIFHLFINSQNKKTMLMQKNRTHFFSIVLFFMFCFMSLEATAARYDMSWRVLIDYYSNSIRVDKKLVGTLIAIPKKGSDFEGEVEDDKDCNDDAPGIDFLSELFMQAIRRGDKSAFCERLLKQGLLVDALIYPSTTLLHWAVWFGRIGVCRVLINAGANIHTKNSSGRTPLHEAAERGFLDCCNLLWRLGAQIDERDASGATPLLVAARMHHKNICQFLLARGACASLKTFAGASPEDYWAVQEVLSELGMFKIIIE